MCVCESLNHQHPPAIGKQHLGEAHKLLLEHMFSFGLLIARRILGCMRHALTNIHSWGTLVLCSLPV
jgi:hypothetical protein